MAKKPTLSQQIDAQLKRDAPAKATHNKPRRSKPLIADTSGSECFDYAAFSASEGGVFVEFAKDGYQEFIPMDRSEAKEFFDADSLGKFYNANYRR
jgi:hypothetical protein